MDKQKLQTVNIRNEPFRYPFYHRTGDTIDKIAFEPYAKVVKGVGLMVSDLAQ